MSTRKERDSPNGLSGVRILRSAGQPFKQQMARRRCLLTVPPRATPVRQRGPGWFSGGKPRQAQAVRDGVRPYIRKARGVDAKWASSISGYWRRGRSEETFRQWKRELAEAEQGANA